MVNPVRNTKDSIRKNKISNGVNVKDLVYLFVGEDLVSMQRKIESLRRQLLKEILVEFNFEQIWANQISPKQLRESLSRLPLDVPRRILVIKELEKFSSINKRIFFSYLKEPSPSLLVILQANVNDLNKDSFLLKVGGIARTFYFRRQKDLNAFDLSRQIWQKNSSLALKVLSQLLMRKEKPSRILGALVWDWERREGESYFSEDKKEFIWQLFLDTDMDIKRTRVKPEFALELLVIRLASLPAPTIAK